ncbi:MAG: LacI family DNA-binding transcriptional regulator [bacterium]
MTIKDVAARAGVSKSTVSRVLNGGPVSEKTREVVQKAIRELNYYPNLQAQTLSKRRTDTIGLIVPEITVSFCTQVIAGVEEAAQKYHQVLILCATKRKLDPELQFVRNLIYGKKIDGLLVLLPFEYRLGYIHELESRGFPLFLIGQPGDLSESNYVAVDNVKGAFEITEYLIGLGHRRIAFIMGRPDIKDSKDRLAGYKKALEEHGLKFDPALVRKGDFTYDSGVRATREILKGDPPPTAIFASNDEMAIGAMREIEKRGLRVPEDIAVVGYDDVPEARLMSPTLTTVAQPMKDMGRVAAEKLLGLIEGRESKPVHIILETQIKVRESSG